MKRDHVVILVFLFGGLIVMTLLGAFKNRSEGFEGSNTAKYVSTLPKCPPGYTFFNGPKGDSFCCRGEVNTYTHTCLAHQIPEDNNMCSFTKAEDPLNSTRKLPLCSALVEKTAAAGSSENCPASLPNYVSDGMGSEKCCKTASENPYDCVDADLADENRHCIVAGPNKDKNPCDKARLLESAECPKDAGFVKFQYPLGTREGPAAAGLVMPVCSRVNETCIPDSAIAYMKTKGVFKDKDIAKWNWSCSTWEKVYKNLDGTVKPDMKYP